MKNLALKTFTILRDLFFNAEGNPIHFKLREKQNTQDDPFDEYIAITLEKELKVYGATCQKSPGPLISPDMAVYKSGGQITVEDATNNPEKVIGIEVKKLERNNGKIARLTGLDYNSTPPCGQVRVYTMDDEEVFIKGFYLFACLEQDANKEYFVSAMTLCDGSILNDDIDLYKEITGSRQKGINLGTYGDGANRNRPMLLFANPLSADVLDNRISLISQLDLSLDNGNIELAWEFARKDLGGVKHVFHVYLDKRDIPSGHTIKTIEEPFQAPKKRDVKTQRRGKFRLNR
jgi:hypothetical protein